VHLRHGNSPREKCGADLTWKHPLDNSEIKGNPEVIAGQKAPGKLPGLILMTCLYQLNETVYRLSVSATRNLSVTGTWTNCWLSVHVKLRRARNSVYPTPEHPRAHPPAAHARHRNRAATGYCDDRGPGHFDHFHSAGLANDLPMVCEAHWRRTCSVILSRGRSQRQRRDRVPSFSFSWLLRSVMGTSESTAGL
jgi:hypothetical protein